MSLLDAAIAANRFGLGARPGELAVLGGHARDALLQQLQGKAPLLPDALASSEELLSQAMAVRAQPRDMREADAASVVNQARKLRDVYHPAYVADILARLRAAVVSERSFVERLVHFWSNHFAVSVDKLVVLGLAGAMEREAIRPHVLGKFSDLLLAVEQHPAMLLYLDNQQSIGPDSQAARIAGRRGRDIGLNENLGREILELHTVGIDGQYTQTDVRSLATLITGWSIGGEAGRLRGGEPGRFYFREAFHEPGATTLLGKRYAEGGLEQGVAALRDLAINPHTARHLATKLVRHFVADEPPAALVEQVAATFRDSGGDLPATYRSLIASPLAWQEPLSKFKTPADYLHSAWRGLALPVAEGQRDLRAYEELGQRNFQPGSPAGWPDRSADWDGSAALMKRLEWAQRLSQRLGVQRNAQALATEMLGATLGAATQRAVARAADGAQALTLLLCSPEFMRR
uniref:Uncharacterized protein n=1 Tax=uncultured bacterium BLR2 TaxID=506520 RepID=B5L5U9_9BACT|nr:conserved hypothetical protein [uncultured bacterium BLR2]